MKKRNRSRSSAGPHVTFFDVVVLPVFGMGIAYVLMLAGIQFIQHKPVP